MTKQEKEAKKRLKEVELEAEIAKELNNDAKLWYKASVCTSKKKQDCFAKAILEQDGIDKLNDIAILPRENSYNANHTGEQSTNSKSKRKEERIAKGMFNLKKFYPEFGEIIDYQTPLKNKRSDEKIGKIDLLAYNEKENTLTLIELKRPNSNETLLRAVLEIYTYKKLVWEEKLKASFKEKHIPENAKLKAAVLLYKDSYPYNDYYDKNRYKCPNTVKLMKELGVEFYEADPSLNLDIL